MNMQAPVLVEHELSGNVARGSLAEGAAALQRALHGFVGLRMNDHGDREDVVQETFVRLCGYPRLDQVRDVRALSFAIARNLLNDRGRAARRCESVVIDEALPCPSPSAEQVVAFRRAVTLVEGALQRMPPLRREIFLRKRLDERSTAEIAATLGMSLAAVEKHVVRALADLRGALVRRGFTMAEGA